MFRILSFIVAFIVFGNYSVSADPDLRTSASSSGLGIITNQSTNPQKTTLGKFLFFDPALSKEGNLSCASCHNPAIYGSDGLATYVGYSHGTTNTPSIYNLAYSDLFRMITPTLTSHMQNTDIMGFNEELTATRLSSVNKYKSMFYDAFKSDKVTRTNILLAITEYLKSLTTQGTFDEFMNGKSYALSDQQKTGLQKFIDVGCTNCHTGPMFGGMNGIPSLRNVEKTYPYGSSGQYVSLQDAIRAMCKDKIDATLTDEDVVNISTFLQVLTGSLSSSITVIPQVR